MNRCQNEADGCHDGESQWAGRLAENHHEKSFLSVLLELLERREEIRLTVLSERSQAQMPHAAYHIYT